MSQSDFVSRGQALVAAGQFQEAVKVCRLGLLGKPTTVEGRVVLGQALLALKRYDEVLAEMRVALELDDTSTPAQLLKGEAHLRKGDAHAAIEALHKALQQAPGDKRVLALLNEAENRSIRPMASTSHPAVGFVSGPEASTVSEEAAFTNEGPTKHYPGHRGAADGDEPGASGSFTKPTSILSTAAKKRASGVKPAEVPRDLAPPRAGFSPDGGDPTPSPDMLAVGDRSGTVEIDPSVDRLRDSVDEELDEPAPPPPGKRAPRLDDARGAVRSGLSPAPAKVAQRGLGHGGPRPSQQTFDLDPEIDDDLADVGETVAEQRKARQPGPKSVVRDAVKMPSGPLGDPALAPRRDRAALPAPDAGPRAKPPTAPPRPLPPPPAPQPLAPQPPPRNLAAAMPTIAAPVAPPAPAPASIAAAARPTLAIPNAPPVEGPAWSRQTMAADHGRAPPPPLQPNRKIAAPNEPTSRPSGLDPAIQALLAQEASERPSDAGGGIVAREPVPMISTGPEPAPRRRRSPVRVVLLVVLALGVIGGGVFAGLQIRAMRLRHQIDDTIDKAAALAKADTYGGWLAARSSFVEIVKASSTLDNRARLARARATIAYEFGDGAPEAKAAVDELADQGGADGDVAAAYVALALGDARAAKVAGDAAVVAAPDDGGALYVVGQALELAGDSKAAVKQLNAAFDKEARPAIAIGLARAQASTYAWDEAIATVDRVLAGNPDHPAAAIARAHLLARAGRVAPGSALGNDARAALERVLADAQKPAAQRNVSPAQAARAQLALVELDFARGDNNAVRADLAAAKALARQNAVIDDEQRFDEEFVEALAFVGQLDEARHDAEVTLGSFATSRRARVVLADVALAQGRPDDALAVLAKQAEIGGVPRALAARGQARVALGNYDDARADFEAALRKVSTLEPALVGRAWLDLALGDVDAAKKPIEAAYEAAKPPSAAIATAYAAVLRRGDKDARDKAKVILEKVVSTPLSGVDLSRAQLELARVDRDLGDVRGAIAHYAEAAKTGSVDARVESGLLQIDNKDPVGGRETLEGVLRGAAKPPASLLLDVARARMLVGDHAGATAALDQAASAPGVEKWRLDRERARLALRRDDARAAAPLIGKALDGCGDDAETFLVAADVPVLDPSQSALADRLAKELKRLAKRPGEAQLVTGKLAIAAGKYDEAERAFATATDLLKSESASSRLIAQAYYGSLLVAYYKNDEPTAMNKVEFIVAADPSLYAAYEASGFMLKDRKQSRSALDQLKKAVALDPELVTAWIEIGQLAAGLGDKAQLQQAIDKLQKLSPADAAELTSKR
jgi:tetratricopeptide (TPR) repeat protein